MQGCLRQLLSRFKWQHRVTGPENLDPKPANNCFSFASLIVERRYHLRRSKSHMEQLTAHGHIEPSDIPGLLLGIQDDLG